MIHFYTCDNLIEAQQILDALHQKNIQAEIVNKNISGAMGEVPFTETWPQIWLMNEEDLYLARDILNKLKQQQTRADLDQYCPQCHEKNPGNFTVCWNCGADLE